MTASPDSLGSSSDSSDESDGGGGGSGSSSGSSGPSSFSDCSSISSGLSDLISEFHRGPSEFGELGGEPLTTNLCSLSQDCQIAISEDKNLYSHSDSVIRSSFYSEPVSIPPGPGDHFGVYTPPSSISPHQNRGAKRDPLEALRRLERLKMTSLKVRSKAIGVPHVRQRRNWDCGLACVEMILRSKRIRFKGLEKEAKTKSIWTVDLAFLLWNRGIPAQLYTTSPGVRKEYSEFNFYADVWDDDSERVNQLYVKAMGDPGLKDSVNVCALKDDEMIHFLAAGKTALIVLVDSRLLRCISCAAKDSKYGGAHTRTEYTGHFVVVVDYDVETRTVYYRNPDSSDALCSISLSAFNDARSAPGTDDDVLVVPL